MTTLLGLLGLLTAQPCKNGKIASCYPSNLLTLWEINRLIGRGRLPFLLTMSRRYGLRIVIYTRVMPHNGRVHRSDRLEAQEHRCRAFATALGCSVARCFKDQGEIIPPHLLPGINALVDYLKFNAEAFLVIADHPARLGIKKETRNMILKKIHETECQFVSVSGALNEKHELISLQNI